MCAVTWHIAYLILGVGFSGLRWGVLVGLGWEKYVENLGEEGRFGGHLRGSGCVLGMYC